MANYQGTAANGVHELDRSELSAEVAITGYGNFAGARVELGIVGEDGNNHFFPEFGQNQNFMQRMVSGRGVKTVIRITNATTDTDFYVSSHNV